jgi:MFS transporter, BCD family, chlorophyll transporter
MTTAAKPKKLVSLLRSVGPQFLPFADAGTTELPLSRLLRLSLFQISVGISYVLLNGTLNRVMIVELGIPAWLVSLMVALPVLFAPARALIGFKSDRHRSALGWRRVPYIWMGTLIQFGGLAILPFALLVLSGQGVYAPFLVGELAAALAFLMIGAGLHTSQTAGISLATDLAPKESRPRVVALLYVMLLVGYVLASLVLGTLLQDYEHIKLIKIIQGAAAVTMVLNLIALWKQEGRHSKDAEDDEGELNFKETFRSFLADRRTARLLVAVGLGCAAFSMQDILLEPYGGEVLKLSVAGTTSLTALMSGGSLLGLFLAARWLRQRDPHLLAALGVLVGIGGFCAIIFSAPLDSVPVFWAGIAMIGLGNGWFSVGTLSASMELSEKGQSGVAIGAWGAAQATMQGGGVLLGGALRDAFTTLATKGALGVGLSSASVGYSFVYHLEIILLFGTLVAIGPLVRLGVRRNSPARFGLAELPN